MQLFEEKVGSFFASRDEIKDGMEGEPVARDSAKLIMGLITRTVHQILRKEQRHQAFVLLIKVHLISGD